ncbi:MAG: glycosyltransferase family 39 protein [Caldilineaceae bacterium]|nr:glycosyltransferase family 39 protein [Caldilineaceae bacterium]
MNQAHSLRPLHFSYNLSATLGEGLLLVLGLALFALQALTISPHKSAAFDEQYHLAAGYSYWKTGDFRLATTHPPLMGLIGASALLGDDTIVLPLDHPAWQAGDRFLFSDVFLWEANPDPQALLVAARQPIVLVGLFLLLVIYSWARQLWGRNGALFVLLLAVFDPNLLANARVVTTDLGLSCFLALASWCLWAWLEKPRGWKLVVIGLAAGLAMSAKYTGLLFWPAALFLILVYPRQADQPPRWQRLLALVGMGLVACTVVWAVYRFTLGPMVDGPLPWPLPAPFYWQQLWWSFTRIIDLQAARLDFFWGEAGAGWWNYFPVALALKTPLPLLLLALLGGWYTLRQHQGKVVLALWTLPLLFLALGMSGILTIGYRHLLPAIPLLLVQAGGAVVWATQWQRPRWGYGLLAVCALWFLVSVLRVYPHQDAYFNELAGPWPQWSSYLVDSNLDWGQDLPALRDWMAAQGVATVNLAYFGKAVPEAYGIHYQPLPGYLRFVEGVELNAYNPFTPEPGWYAISATSLRLGLMQPESVDLYAFFRDQVPVGRAGYSIYLYQVSYPADLPVERRVLYGEAASRLPADHLGADQAGRLPQRVQVKWVQSPETALYPLGQGLVLPTGPTYHPVDANFEDIFTFLGYATAATNAKPGDDVTFTLFWRKGTQPMPMPAPTRGNALSMFLHITGDDPTQIITQFDGWRTALRGLEDGDVIAMPATVSLGDDIPAGVYPIRLGLYSPQSWARLTVQGADHVQIGTLVVTP